MDTCTEKLIVIFAIMYNSLLLLASAAVDWTHPSKKSFGSCELVHMCLIDR